MRLTRRAMLRGVGGLAALHLAGFRGVARAEQGGLEARLVVVLLRGGMDGLAAVPVPGDPHWGNARAGLAGAAPGETDGPLALDDTFALDPRLANLHAMFRQGELLVAHAVALPYRDRSHFDAQNLLESGGREPFANADGWLGRALREGIGTPELAAVGLQPVLPLLLRGAEGAVSWSPTALPPPSAELLEQAARLYAGDPALSRALSQARRVGGIVGGERASHRADASFPALAEAAGAFLAEPRGARLAVLELGGWDSHSLQSLPYGGLARSLRALDAGMGALRARLGESWKRTVVIASTEFGRTVAMNGSGGTDHGTAGAAFVLGGAVAGGRVVCDWPGLLPAQLHEGRDLRPTHDLRALWKGVLHDHLRISRRALASRVFPGTEALAPWEGLVRA